MAEASQILYPKSFMSDNTGDDNSADAVDTTVNAKEMERKNQRVFINY